MMYIIVAMHTGYKIYFFIKDTLCYIVLGVVLLPLRFLLSGGLPVLGGSLGFIAAWRGGKASLSEAPPIGTFFVAFLKWLVVFAVSVSFWGFVATVALGESPVSSESQSPEADTTVEQVDSL